MYRLKVHNSLFYSVFALLWVCMHWVRLRHVIRTYFVDNICIQFTLIFGKVLCDDRLVSLFNGRHVLKVMKSFTEVLEIGSLSNDKTK
jgi:hypothetical protein